MMSPSSRLTHLNEDGQVHMVDVAAKETSKRKAIASGCVYMQSETAQAIGAGRIEKGDVLAVARVAGIMAAKKTPDIIPLCHSLALTGVSVTLELFPKKVSIQASVTTKAMTGVEMEALHAVCAAALTIYDMCKAIDRGMSIGDVQLDYKTGGRSGTYSVETTR